MPFKSFPCKAFAFGFLGNLASQKQNLDTEIKSCAHRLRLSGVEGGEGGAMKPLPEASLAPSTHVWNRHAVHWERARDTQRHRLP